MAKGKAGTRQHALCHPDKLLTGRGLCKSCYYKNWWKGSPKAKQKERECAFRRRLQRTYCATPMDVLNVWNTQGGCCPICQAWLPIPTLNANTKNKRVVAIDHCHRTGRIRGIVCAGCNSTKIGSNTLETAKRLVDYLGK